MPLRRWRTSETAGGRRLVQGLRWGLALLSVVLYLVHFLHLSADFPAGTDWTDWSRFTDEGWYSDAATRHFVLGHWFLPGDFNPAVVTPTWPLLLALVFAVTGVSLAAARGLAVALFGLTLLGVWLLLDRKPKAHTLRLAAPCAVLLLAASPFVYAFEREAVLEPMVVALSVWALVAAGRLQDRETHWRGAGPALALGLLMPAMVLTKPTAVALFPAVLWMIWGRAGYRVRAAMRLGLPPLILAAVVWSGYFLLWVRPRYLEDYQYLFSANNYTSFQSEPLWQVMSATVGDATWMGATLCVAVTAVLVWLIIRRPAALKEPLVPALLLWMAGTLAFLGYHNNLQARYYLLLAVPATMLVGVGLEALCTGADLKGVPGSKLAEETSGRRANTKAAVRNVVALACVLVIAVPDAIEQIRFALHPSYSFVDAARCIAAVVRADRGHSPWVLSVSGADLSLMTRLPAINTEFSTLDLDQLIAQYRPGWYVTWNQVNDEDMVAIAPLYWLIPVAAFPAMDDPDRNQLLLYRMERK